MKKGKIKKSAKSKRITSAKRAARPRKAPKPARRASAKKAVRVGVLAAALASAHVRQKLIDVAGENALHVIKGFNKSMSDEELARRTKLKVSDVRVVLNRLHNCGLAKYYRNRDKDSGWYSYVWCFEEQKLGEFARIAEQDVADGAEQGEWYACAACGPESAVGFEAASLKMFRCQYCGGSLEFVEK